MKIDKAVYIESSSVGNFRAVESSISESNLGMALDAVSKNLYSNPIGSFVREVTSNGVDANKRNNQDDLVKVEIYQEDGSWYFQVTDKGKGMSLEVFQTVYMSWFESDKRDSNDQIGGWGVGSKSPLAYSDSYEVITINEGIEYHWIIAREFPKPKATLISERKTSNHSGTIVKIEVEEKDLLEVHTECVRQLAYFNNVVVVNEKYFYDNTFTIVETDKYRVRTGERPYSTMHICLGQVPYPIDWDFLGMEPIRLPVALTFGINELPVTLSRESINYKKKDFNIKEVLNKRISEAYDDIYNRYNDQMSTDNFDDFFKYLNAPKALVHIGDVPMTFDIGRKRKPRPSITIEEEKYSIAKDDFLDVFDQWKVLELDTKKQVLKNAGKSLSYLDVLTSTIALKKEEPTHWKNLYYSRFNSTYKVIEERNHSLKAITFRYSVLLGKSYEKNLKKKGTNMPSAFTTSVLELGARRYAYKFYKTLRTWVESKTVSYDRVPEWFIAEEKEKQRLLKEEKKGLITYYDTENKSQQISLEKLYEYKYVFYANKEWDEHKLFAYHFLFESMPDWAKKKYIFIKVAATTYRKIKSKKDKFKSVKNVFNVADLKNWFIRIRLIYERSLLRLQGLNDISKYYYKLYNFVVKKYKTTLTDINTSYNITKYIDTDYGTRRKKTEWIFVNLYNVFREEINSLGVGRHEREQAALKELKTMQIPLLLLKDLSIRIDDHAVIIKDIMNQYKKEFSTKLNPEYYGKKANII